MMIQEEDKVNKDKEKLKEKIKVNTNINNYIDTIDNLIDKILDDFYNYINSKINIILEEQNFIKHLSIINVILISFIKDNLANYKLNTFSNNKDSILYLEDIIKKYICYYLFLYIGGFYNNKRELYINNVIEISKNQPSYEFKSNSFFNSESNSNIIKYYNTLKSILAILETNNKEKLTLLRKNANYKDGFSFLDIYDKNIIQDFFRTKSKKNNLNNIIKIIIVNELYFTTDKKNIFNMLEEGDREVEDVKDIKNKVNKEENKEENTEKIYKYIDINMPNKYIIDISSISNVLNLNTDDLNNNLGNLVDFNLNLNKSKENKEVGLEYEIYDLLKNKDKYLLTTLSDIKVNDKLQMLFSSKTLIPIVEDFMLYHKDNEKYDNIENKNKEQDVLSSKKENIKIKYILDKIDTATEFYNDNNVNKVNKNNVNKVNKDIFYKPLLSRKAIIVNNVEDITLINKLINISGNQISSNEYYNDLLSYRQYPYINFKQLSQKGFSFDLNVTKPIDCIRFTSLANESKNDTFLQMRIGSDGQILNIVGLALNNSKNHINCLNLNNFNSVTYDKLNENLNKNKNNIYIFERDIDKEEENLEKENKKENLNININKNIIKKIDNDKIKLLISKLYDNKINMLYFNIIFKLNTYKTLNYFTFNNIIKNLEVKHKLTLEKSSNLFNNLKFDLYYNKLKKNKQEYDINDDKFPGLYGDILKLPSYKAKLVDFKIVNINSINRDLDDDKVGDDGDDLKNKENKVDLNKKDLSNLNIIAICQHVLRWDKISMFKKKDPVKFSKLIFEFIYKYVLQTENEDYICKSCSAQLNLKKYIQDGSYDSNNNFIRFNSEIDTPLDELRDYEQYSVVIKNIDKKIEQIANICNITMYIDQLSKDAKSRRRSVTKNVLDMLLIHNPNMRKKYKDRSDQVSKIYNINKNSTNLFVFDVENKIYSYSSVDKDFYKSIKQNNILVYILMYLIVDLTDTQIVNLGIISDKICNIEFFDKFGFINLFENIKIAKNDKVELININNYKSLCFVMYYMSCMITKYKLWLYDDNISLEVKNKKFNPIIQKNVISTMIDLTNSILEIYAHKKNNYVYTLFSVKFFEKLSSVFKDDNILVRIRDSIKIKLKKGITGNIDFVSKIKSILVGILVGELGDDLNYLEVKKFDHKFDMFLKSKVQLKQDVNVSNLNMCESGTFHTWVYTENKNITCKTCLKQLSNLTYNLKDSNICLDSYEILYLNKTYKSLTGITNEKLSNQELEMKIIEINDKDNIKIKEKVNLNLNLNLNQDYLKIINDFVNIIEETIGKNININGSNMYLRENCYIIDHDHNGYSLDKERIILENRERKENNIKYKKNDIFFKTDVLYYTNMKVSRIDVYYDAKTYRLLGYKESDRDYKRSEKNNKYLKVNYSIINILDMLGYESKYYALYDLSNISRLRIRNLKKTLDESQRYLNRLKNKYYKNVNLSLNKEFIHKYTESLSLNANNKLNLDNIFKDWQLIKDISYQKNDLDLLDLENLKEKMIEYSELSKFDTSGNEILTYILMQFIKLLNINSDKYTRVKISYLLLDILINTHLNINTERLQANIELNKFKYILTSDTFMAEENNSYNKDDTVVGIYEEYLDLEDKDKVLDPDNVEDAKTIEQNIDLKEEFDAVDLDVPLDDDFYEHDVEVE